MASNNNIVEQIQNSIDIADIIGERVKLRKSSRGYMGLCPFHNEHTPSFHVYTDTQSYYCFACHEAGNVFSFLMKLDGLTFPEALEILAERAGVALKQYTRDKNSRTLYDVMNIAAEFFTKCLLSSQGTAARAYMKRRNMGASDVGKFSLGYAPNSWDALTNYLRKAGITDKMILDAGLALENSRGIYDRFRGRLIFPVKDVAGRVIAFGGRVIDGDGAKYINSPESEIYSKRRNLYLLNDARKFIRERRRSILVEGYMDALRLHKAGFGEAVASLGTSLTGEQAELLSSYAERCYICYDGDTAGQNATIRGMYILQTHGLDVHVVNLPDGQDPDDFLTANSPEKFEQALRDARPLVVQHIEVLRPKLSDPMTRKQTLNELFSGLSELSHDEVLQYKAQLSEATLLPPSELEKKILHDTKELHTDNSKAPVKAYDDLPEAAFCAMILRSRECRLKVKPEDIYTLLKSNTAQQTASAILDDNPDTLPVMWLTTGDTEKTALIARGEEFCRSISGDKWQKIYGELMTRAVNERMNEIRAKMTTNSATLSELQELCKLQKQKDMYIV